jgi:hypothetical protein
MYVNIQRDATRALYPLPRGLLALSQTLQPRRPEIPKVRFVWIRRQGTLVFFYRFGERYALFGRILLAHCDALLLFHASKRSQPFCADTPARGFLLRVANTRFHGNLGYGGGGPKISVFRRP